MALRQKHESNLTIADQMLEVAQSLLINDRNNPGLIPLAAGSDSPSLKVNVVDIEDRHFCTSQTKARTET